MLLGFFSCEEIPRAKDSLWSFCGPDIVREKLKKKDSPSRSCAEANMLDIFSAWSKLDKVDSIPTVAICALSLGMIPRSHAEELNSMTLADRLNRLEEKMNNIQSNMDEMVTQNLTLKDEIGEVNSYASHLKFSITSLLTDKSVVQPTVLASMSKSITNMGSVETGPTFKQQAKTPLIVKPAVDKSSLPQHLDDDGFSLPSHVLRQQKRVAKKKYKVISGSGNADSIRGAPELSRDIFVYRVHDSTTVDDMESYITDMGLQVRNIECISKPGSCFKSFHVTITVSQLDKSFEP